MTNAPRGAGRERLLLALTVTLALAAGILAFLYWGSRDTSRDEVDEYLSAQAGEVRGAATEIAELLTNYDSRTIDRVGDRLLELTTGEFRADYEELLPGLGPALERARVGSTGEIVSGPEVSFGGADEAIAPVKIEQRIRVRTDPRGREVVLSMRFTFERNGESWRADGFAIEGEE